MGRSDGKEAGGRVLCGSTSNVASSGRHSSSSSSSIGEVRGEGRRKPPPPLNFRATNAPAQPTAYAPLKKANDQQSGSSSTDLQSISAQFISIIQMVHSSQWKWYCLVTPEADFCRQNNFVNTPAVAHRCLWSSPLVLSLIRVSSNLDPKSIWGTWATLELLVCPYHFVKHVTRSIDHNWWIRGFFSLLCVRVALIEANDADFLKCRWWILVRIKVGVTVVPIMSSASCVPIMCRVG